MDLKVDVGGLTLKNPFIAGGGPLAGTVDHIRRCVDSGLGGVVTKTASTVWYLQRYPRPHYLLLDYKKDASDPFFVPESYFWMHREHNSSYPPMQFAKIIAEAAPYAKEKNCAIIGNFSARFPDEWVEIATAYEAAGCSALELNFCCPFPPEGLAKSPADNHVGIYYSQHPDEAIEVLQKIKAAVKIPVWVKLSPDGSNFVQTAKKFYEAGASGITMFANGKTVRVDIETGEPRLHGATAGTGPGIKGIGMRWTAEVAAACDIAVLGNRGLSTWQDAVEFIMAGADAVEYCSPLMIHGLGYVQKLIDGLSAFMERKGYQSVADFHDMALNRMYSNTDMVEKVKALCAEIDTRLCIGCGRCNEVCCYDAIRFVKKATMRKENCAGCTLCMQLCPANAISMRARENDNEHFRAMYAAHKDLAPPDVFGGADGNA